MIFIVMKITTSQIQVSGNLCSCGEHKPKYNLKYSCGYTGHKYAFHQNLISRITFSWRDLTTPNWKLLSWKSPHAFGIPVQWTPPCPRNSSRRNPPSASEFRDAARGMGMDIFWNHPIWLFQCNSSSTEYRFATLSEKLENLGSFLKMQ